MTDVRRRLPVGAELVEGGGVNFRVWAPGHRVEVVILGSGDATPHEITLELSAEEAGYHSGTCPEAGAGSLYQFRLDDDGRFPDPCSRYQPDGPHGPSRVVDPRFDWSDGQWPGIGREGHVIYELHLGTYTKQGTWSAAMEQLPALVELGITLVEVMPVADFPGRFGWGYDGVSHFAPCRLYGEPDDMRRFVDRAHALGLGVLLDVVYNHFGPEGNYLERFSQDYYGPKQNEWGKAINFDCENNGPVREFFTSNAVYWISEFHLDGLRFDATHAIKDSSQPHILGAITEQARQAAGGRRVLMVAENESQEAACLRPKDKGGFGMDAVWNDDFHHCAHVALTGYHDAYYSEYCGLPQELVSAVKWGYLYQGQRYFWQGGKRRGTPTIGVNRSCFIHFTQNHDQIGNSAWGLRLHRLTNPAQYRAMTALLLLGPQTPMLFQGQDFCASSPFLYFSDLNPETSRQVHSGRVEYLKQFTNINSPEVIATIDKPYELDTFILSRLDLSQRERHDKIYAMHRDLIKLRREDPVISNGHSCNIEGAVLDGHAFVLRYFHGDQQRLLLMNLGRELHLAPVPEPLLAPPEGGRWEVLWSSEQVEYGGAGTTPHFETDQYWRLQGNMLVVLAPVQDEDGM